MPSFCQDLKTSYEHLQKLTAEFRAKYSGTKELGDLGVLKKLQKDLEAAKDTLCEYLPYFIVPNAKNPYHEALLAAGLKTTETAERQDTKLDLQKEIQRQLAVYSETMDNHDDPCLEEWVKDITENEHLIYTEIIKDRANIMERIKEGMIPVVMPRRDVQINTWKTTLRSLKPVSMKDGIEQSVGLGNFENDYQDDHPNKMTTEGFFDNIPDRPYLMWVKPTQEPELYTMDLSFDEQQAFHKTLVEKYPNLYDWTDIIPTEYTALQAIFTSHIRARFKEMRGKAKEPTNITPLDTGTYTRFLSTGKFSDGYAPSADFFRDEMCLAFASNSARSDDISGFRPVSRT